jgi:hypothetical protein
MPAAHEVKFEEKSSGDAVCAAALATAKAAAILPARSGAVEANQADYDAWQKRDLLLDAVVLSLQNGGGFKIPWRDDRRSASRVVSVLQTTPMRLDYETRSTVAGRRLHLRICVTAHVTTSYVSPLPAFGFSFVHRGADIGPDRFDLDVDDPSHEACVYYRGRGRCNL